MPTNVLSADNATFETSLGDWTTTGGTRVTSPTPHAGSGVLKVPYPDMAAVLPYDITPEIPNGHLVTVTAWLRNTGTGNADFGMAATSESYAATGNYFVDATDTNTTDWKQHGYAGFPMRGSGTDTIRIEFFRNGGGAAGDYGLASDVVVAHEPVSPPSGLAVVAGSPGGFGTPEAVLTWSHSTPDQYFGYVYAGAPAAQLHRSNCRARVERSDDGGAYSEITNKSATASPTYTDPFVLPGVVYRYRVRYSIHPTSGSSPGPILGYTTYTNVATYQGVGGWGVGMVRMGAN